MKVQELLPGSKPSPAPRGARSNAPTDAQPSDFADALTEARKKPESKPADAEAPGTKKPAAAKQATSPRDESAPADDAVGPEQSIPADQAEAPTAVEGGEPVLLLEVDEPVDPDNADKATEPALPKAQADLSVIAMTQMAGPQPLPTEDVSGEDLSSGGDAEVIDGAEQMIARPNFQRQAQLKATEDNPETAGVPLDLDEIAGGEGGDDLPLALPDAAIDPARIPKPPAEQRPAPPAAAIETGQQPEPESSAHGGGDKRPLPKAMSEFALAADASEDAMGSEFTAAAAADGSSDATTTPTTSTTMHASPEIAKAPATQATPSAPPAPAPLPPQAHFADANHPKIVTAVQTHMLTNGGTMQIRLDPPELGALHVMVHMQDGVMTASFHTSNDDATRLLSHSLSQLKQVLESQGVSVEKLQVQQSPKDQQPGNEKENAQHQRDQHDDAHRQEQQRKEMLRRMWRRLANGSDPLDLVA